MMDFDKLDNLIDEASAQNAQKRTETEKAGNPAPDPLKLEFDRLAGAEQGKIEVESILKSGGSVYDALKAALKALGMADGGEDLLQKHCKEYAARKDLEILQAEIAAADPQVMIEKQILDALEAQKERFEEEIAPASALEMCLDASQISEEELRSAAFVLGLLKELVTRSEGAEAWQKISAEELLALIVKTDPAGKTRAKLKRKQKDSIIAALDKGEAALDVLVGALKLAGYAASDSKFFAKCADPLERIYHATLPAEALKDYKDAKAELWLINSRLADPGTSEAEKRELELSLKIQKDQMKKLDKKLVTYGIAH